MRLLIASMSVSSVVFAGCVQQRKFDEVQTSQTTPQTQQPTPTVQAQESKPDVPYVPTPNEVVARMLELANVTGDDILYDLGSGDGRIVITAAQKHGTRGTGIDINPELVQQSQANAQAANVADRVEFVQQDLFQTDLSDATVVTLYLLPDVNLKLRPKLLQELKPGTRIVSHDFDMGEWEPARVEQVQGPTRQHTIYHWVVPENVPDNLR
ncbi:class I SAM-dependent methyltransferase [Microcoleus sp. FACHB-SPT15]|uniref:class I SAM-dependent methyltransferase n=1 Tax=Microcoleus sp. FACHB-SPT15 TaxID=2692830 RepID=UPI001F5498B3|nr:class I SAM-dependent methyltransferase [Microcoleus sp. FACHB-SPT15]